MRWHELVFLHWPVPAEELRPLLPPRASGLELDTFDGVAWLGVVPFRMSGVRPRLLPAVPWLSAFAELNVRTYVTAEGKAGVWFFSLDAANPIAVRVARWTFHLPYFDARMRTRRAAEGGHGPTIDYESTRTHRGAAPARFAARYRATAPPRPSTPESLAAFLTDRYCLYAADRRGRVLRGDIQHEPWPLQEGEVELRACAMTEQIGIALPERAPLVHYSERLDVVAWSPEPLGAPVRG